MPLLWLTRARECLRREANTKFAMSAAGKMILFNPVTTIMLVEQTG